MPIGLVTNQSQREFILVLREMALKEGMASLSKKTGLSREGLYKILDKDGNPKLETLMKIIDALGLQFDSLIPISEDAKKTISDLKQKGKL